MTVRREIDTPLRGETLVRKGLKHRQTASLRLVPELNVVKIGGHGIIDYGREVVLPLVEEIGDLSRQHKILGEGWHAAYFPSLSPRAKAWR